MADDPVGQGLAAGAVLLDAAVTIFNVAKLGTKLLIVGGKKPFHVISRGIGKLLSSGGDDVAKGAGRAADAAGDAAKGADDAVGAADDAAQQVDEAAESTGKSSPNSQEPDVNGPGGGSGTAGRRAS